jgi:peptidoglycan/xylan/chitin deacetylase (PgdA/CDA1 family)
MIAAPLRRHLQSVGKGWGEAVELAASSRRKLYGPITSVQTTDKVVALTFDDGPHPINTPRLLEVLRRYGAKATFFMLGRAAQAYPDLVDVVAQAGHAIGNHSYSHCDFLKTSRRQRKEEILACSKSLRGHESKIFRPPYGRENLACHIEARILGYTVVKWSISAGDWIERTGAEMSSRISRQLDPGAIVLLHDGIAKNPGADQSSTIEAVESILGGTIGAYSYVTIPEMFKLGRLRRSVPNHPGIAGL